MRMFQSCLAAGIAIASVISAAPASATQFTYLFSTHLTNSSGYVFNTGSVVPTGNGTLLSKSGTGTNASGLNASISAWNGTTNPDATTTIAQAQLGVWDGGLGVISGYDNYNGCGTGNCGMHQIDNVGNTPGSVSYDFVQVTFSQAVTLTAISRYAFGQQQANGSMVYDDDFSYGHGTTQQVMAAKPTSGTGALASNTSMSTPAFDAMFGTSIGANGSCNGNNTLDGSSVCFDQSSMGSTSTSTTASTTWWIAASLLNPDSKADAFKLYDFTVVYNDAPVTVASVPEPASWTMMIGGFGLVGTAMRRRKAQGRIAAA